MRLLLFSIIVCLGWPAFAANELSACADIQGATERLDCYDRLARETSAREKAAAPAGQREIAPAEPARRPEPPRPPPAEPTGSDPVVDEAAGPRAAGPSLAEERKRRAAATRDHVEARIERVRKAPAGQQIMTLSNGQVWVENEPGRRGIAPGQDVSIRKRRWHYEMELDSQPNVAVRRVE